MWFPKNGPVLVLFLVISVKLFPTAIATKNILPATTIPTKINQCNAPTTKGGLFAWNNIRLPDNVVPRSYRIFMHPNLTTFDFSGTVNIDFIVKNSSTNFLVFHSRDLSLSHISLQSKIKRTKVNIVSNLECVSLNQVYLGLDRDLSVDATYTLSVSFNGELSDQILEGFYKSSYISKGGQRRYVST